MSNLTEVFEQQGRPLAADGSCPFLLTDSQSVWLVCSGKIDLFAVVIEQGQPVGPRRPMFRMEAGHALFGMEPERQDRGVGLLAVGHPGTHLRQLARAQLQQRTHDPTLAAQVARLVERWVQDLSSALPAGPAPRKYQDLAPGQALRLAPDAVARSGREPVWVQPVEGRCHFLDSADLPLLTDGPPVPISRRTWLRAAEPAHVQVLDTATVLAESPSWSCLDAFHALALNCIQASVVQTTQTETYRLHKRAQADRSVLGHALSRLASVMEAGPSAAPTVEEQEDPLLLACRWVGREQGITIKAPGGAGQEGRSQDALDAITRASRVRARRVALRGDWWHHDNGPLLGFVEEDNRPVALLPTGTRHYDVMDPADGARRRVTRETAVSLSSFAHMFYRPFPQEAHTVTGLLRFGFQSCAPRDLLTVLLMGIGVGLLGLFVPIATGIIFDTIIPSAARDQLLHLALALVAMAIGTSGFHFVQGVAMLRVETQMGTSIQASMWDRLLRLPAPFFRRYLAGDLAQRSLGIDTIQDVLTGAAYSAVLGGIFSIFSFALLFHYARNLALVAAALMLVAVLVVCLAGWRKLRFERRLHHVQGRIEGLVLQFITGIAKLRVASAEPRAFAVWAEQFAEKKRLAFSARTVGNALAVFTTVFPIMATMVIFAVLAGHMAGPMQPGRTPLSTGSFLAFNAAFGQFLAATLQMSTVLVSVLEIIPIYERAKPILQTPPEVDVAKTAPGELSGAIEISHAGFRYHPETPPVLDDISMQIRPGEFVAVVGPSGAGKSSLLRLLLGFESPESGAVYYDGQDLAGLDVHAVRRQIGVVLQNAQVLPGTIFENIVGAAPLGLDDALEAARLAGLDRDIDQMPMGIHTLVTEGGSTLSGGQRQRLLIARAVVSRPRILLFDEATSSLDNRTQDLVRQNLERLHATRVVIAHRLSTIANADRICVLVGGRIVQVGTYDQLLSQEGIFAELAKRQLT